MKKNGYINASKLCKDAGKEFRHWTDNKTSKRLIYLLTAKIDNILISIRGGRDTLIRETYVHPILVTYIAIWCSQEFALKFLYGSKNGKIFREQ